MSYTLALVLFIMIAYPSIWVVMTIYDKWRS